MNIDRIVEIYSLCPLVHRFQQVGIFIGLEKRDEQRQDIMLGLSEGW